MEGLLSTGLTPSSSYHVTFVVFYAGTDWNMIYFYTLIQEEITKIPHKGHYSIFGGVRKPDTKNKSILTIKLSNAIFFVIIIINTLTFL